MVTVTPRRRKLETGGAKNRRRPRYSRLKAKVPFVGQLAYEFKRSKAHIYLILSGERKDASPSLVRALRARHKELLAAARKAA